MLLQNSLIGSIYVATFGILYVVLAVILSQKGYGLPANGQWLGAPYEESIQNCLVSIKQKTTKERI